MTADETVRRADGVDGTVDGIEAPVAVGGTDGAGVEADRLGLVRLAFGPMAGRVVYTAVRMRIADLIGDGERTADAVARDCGAHPQATHRLLRALASLGLLAQSRAGGFTVTSTGALLSETRPDSFGGFVRLLGDPAMLDAWEYLEDSVRTGETSFPTVFGTDFFSHLRQSPELSARFNAAMGQGTFVVARMLPGSYDFSPFTHVVDVGGGDGTLLAAVLQAHPGLRGVVFDTAEGLSEAEAVLDREGVADRASTRAGDFFASVPEGGDLYLLKSVLHDWDDQRCAVILRHCREVLPPHGRLLIVEPVLPATVGADSSVTYLTDLNMLVNMGGRERTGEEFTELCREAGLSDPTITPLPSHVFHLIETAPAP